MAKEKGKDGQLEILGDVLEEKATATIRMRALDFGRFIRWAESVGASSLDIAEALAYDYCRFLRASHSSSTSVKRFRESAMFAVHVFGWSASDGFCDSRRIAGVGVGMLKMLGPVRRAQPFDKNLLKFLELKLADENLGVAERFYAGMVLFLVYTRCLFTDAQRITLEPELDGNYLRATLKEYKTSRARDRRGMALQLVAPAIAAYGTPWAQIFLDLRKRLQIVAGEASPFFVAFDGNLPSAAGVTLAEANVLIRRFVHEAAEKELITCDDYNKFSSHSCKRTLLSWAAKAGLDLDTRRLLGHHVIKSDGSWLAYSHDALAHPVNELIKVISNETVDQKKDETPNQVGRDETPDVDLDITSSCSSSDGASSGTETKQLSDVISRVGDPSDEPDPELYEIIRHSKYGTLHLRARLSIESGDRLLCGRLVGSTYAVARTGFAGGMAKCMVCVASLAKRT